MRFLLFDIRAHHPGPPARRMVAVLLLLALAGCALPPGITERDWNAGWRRLEAGLDPATARTWLGEPRSIEPAPSGAFFTATWIYTRPEVVGRRPQLTGEREVMLPSGRATVSLPEYEDVDLRAVVTYRLRWQDERLLDWARDPSG